MGLVARILGIMVVVAIVGTLVASVAMSLPDIARYFRIRSM